MESRTCYRYLVQSFIKCHEIDSLFDRLESFSLPSNEKTQQSLFASSVHLDLALFPPLSCIQFDHFGMMMRYPSSGRWSVCLCLALQSAWSLNSQQSAHICALRSGFGLATSNTQFRPIHQVTTMMWCFSVRFSFFKRTLATTRTLTTDAPQSSKNRYYYIIIIIIILLCYSNLLLLLLPIKCANIHTSTHTWWL